jgi:ubiquinone/menaquinone biosynthesis C-methylase UbiE
LEAVALLGDEGRLVSTDFSPNMLDVARRRGTELGLLNLDYRVIDAERIELAADSVDGVLCQSTYMLVGDPAAALAETRRVLRPDGRLALSVWGAPKRNPALRQVKRVEALADHVRAAADGDVLVTRDPASALYRLVEAAGEVELTGVGLSLRAARDD